MMKKFAFKYAAFFATRCAMLGSFASIVARSAHGKSMPAVPSKNIHKIGMNNSQIHLRFDASASAGRRTATLHPARVRN